MNQGVLFALSANERFVFLLSALSLRFLVVGGGFRVGAKDDLPRHTRWAARVRAKNNYGWGAFGNWTTLGPGELRAPSAPDKPEVVRANTHMSTLEVSWKAPPFNGAHILMYQVCVCVCVYVQDVGVYVCRDMTLKGRGAVSTESCTKIVQGILHNTCIRSTYLVFLAGLICCCGYMGMHICLCVCTVVYAIVVCVCILWAWSCLILGLGAAQELGGTATSKQIDE